MAVVTQKLNEFIHVVNLILTAKHKKVVGVISRVPKKGSFLSNLSKGAIPKSTKLTNIEKRISNLIAKDLKKENIKNKKMKPPAA